MVAIRARWRVESLSDDEVLELGDGEGGRTMFGVDVMMDEVGSGDVGVGGATSAITDEEGLFSEEVGCDSALRAGMACPAAERALRTSAQPVSSVRIRSLSCWFSLIHSCSLVETMRDEEPGLDDSADLS